jgi:ABC-type sugar transport system permease subunit
MYENEKNKVYQENSDNSNKMIIESKGKIHTNKNGTAVYTRNIGLFTALGWTSIALAAFVAPFFAIAGIIFGVLLNRQIEGRGNVIIIASVVLGTAKYILGYIFLTLIR